MSDEPRWSAEVLRRAAEKPYPPPRLLRVADLVVEGKTTWDQVASGECDDFHVQMLSTPKARETLWPVLAEVAAELEAARAAEAVRERTAQFTDGHMPETWLVDSFELPEMRWREGEVYGKRRTTG